MRLRGLASVFCSVAAVAAQGGFETGRHFPNLQLPSLEDGRPRSIADYRGQKLILHIFASW